MANTPHELAEEVPDQGAAISALKQSDAHFAKLAAACRSVNHTLHRAETHVEPMSDLAEADLR